MQKKNPNKNKLIKQTIIITAIALLLLLLIFAENIIKSTNKNKLNLAENTEQQITGAEPNPPTTSAGMIPIKWDGENWKITTNTNNDWYDYKNGKPAYAMLNDGYYKSELELGIESKQLMENNIETVISHAEDLGTIVMWVPRFAINENGSDIKYIKGVEIADAGWTIPEMFTYRQTSETAPDFLLTGIWLEKDADSTYASKINQMNQEESIYGFVRNTVAVPGDQTTQNQIQQYIANLVGATSVRNTPENLPNVALSTEEYPIDITNSNRIILKKINQTTPDPIKATATYNKNTGLIEVQATFTQYGIEKIILENQYELNFIKTNRTVTAYTDGIDLEDGINIITIVDTEGNKKELKVEVVSRLYATLYTDGTLAFGKSSNPIPEKTIKESYGDISGKSYGVANRPWSTKISNIRTVEFVNKIYPTSTAYWFYDCANLTTINNIEKLNTNNVTNMYGMFFGCSGLSSLDLSRFNTNNVTNMLGMFNGCSNLSSLDLSSFDTSKVTDMNSMFANCSRLTSLDLSSFDTSNVTNMSGMFQYCGSLTSVNLSGFDTSNVININSILRGVTSLSQITFGEKWDKEITLPTLTKPCAGWYSDTVFTNKVAEAGANYTPAGPITIYANVPPDIYVKLYTDGTLAFCSNNSQIPFKTLSNDYGNIGGQDYMYNTLPWRNEEGSVTNTYIIDEIYPTSTAYWFYNCVNLTTINNIENLNTSKVTNMNYMFYGCSSLSSIDVSNFDTSKVTNMNYMFYGCSSLSSIDVSNFDTSNVTNMTYMFYGCSSLSSIDVSNFDTSKVTNMNSMFYGCSSLSSIDVSNLNTSNVTNMGGMFAYCSSLTSIDVSNFDTTNATNMNIFSECNSLTQISFGEKCNKVLILPKPGAACSGWYSEPEFITKIATAGTSYTPTGAITIYAEVISDLYVKLYTDGTLAFCSNDSLMEKELSVDYGNIAGKSYTLSNSTPNVPWYNDRGSIQTVNIVDEIFPVSTAVWFCNCTNITKIDNISNLNTYKVTNMYSMFNGCSNLTSIDVSNFDTSKVTSMYQMFYNCSSLSELDLSNFDTSSVTSNYYDMIAGCTGLNKIAFGEKWDKRIKLPTPIKDELFCAGWYSEENFINKVAEAGASYTPINAITLYANFVERIYATYYTEGILAFGTSNDLIPAKTENAVYYGDISEQIFRYVSGSGNTHSCTTPWYSVRNNITTVKFVNEIAPISTAYWFFDLTNLTTINNIEKLNMRNVANMNSMFAYCSSLTSVDLSNFDTRNATTMIGTFCECRSLTSIDVSKFNTSNVTTMQNMFYGCSSLTRIDVSNFNTSNVTNMVGMFYKCSGVTSLDLSSFNTSNVANTSSMFAYCSSVTSIDVSSFNTSNVTNMSGMFYNCSNLKTIYVNNSTSMWSNSIKNSTSSSSPYYNMFTGCGTSTVTRK